MAANYAAIAATLALLLIQQQRHASRSHQ